MSKGSTLIYYTCFHLICSRYSLILTWLCPFASLFTISLPRIAHWRPRSVLCSLSCFSFMISILCLLYDKVHGGSCIDCFTFVTSLFFLCTASHPSHPAIVLCPSRQTVFPQSVTGFPSACESLQAIYFRDGSSFADTREPSFAYCIYPNPHLNPPPTYSSPIYGFKQIVARKGTPKGH